MDVASIVVNGVLKVNSQQSNPLHKKHHWQYC